ncbi:c-type cytochrome [Uliginosibacterium sp. H3]|uniref:C-type cytochrome n=1 Tax=Uliginosibacterium silvisoli TaxID=3114758 RepID=A0ABU6K8M7_9RHOO|nr:c-type cytochrome [Uliginosibacterium sp. H3]
MIKRKLFLSLALASHFVCQTVTATETAKAAPLDLAKAKQTAEQVCAACHGADGNSIIAINPSLAGQFPEYLTKQLANFKSQNGKPAERNNPVMSGMAAPLSDADMKALAVYFSQQKAKPDLTKNKANIALGQKIWRAGDASKGLPACAGCHGAAGAGIPAQFPRLSGQHPEYIEAQLRSFRDNVRTNDANGAMRTIAIRMTEPEIKAVADYAAGLR